MVLFANIFIDKTACTFNKKLFVSFLFLSSFALHAASNLTSTSVNTKNTVIESNESLLKFSQLTTLDGLSNSNVFGITQDHQGFIWFATEDGLNRFDGKNFITYRHNANNKHSIAGNIIRKVFIDSENTLWIGTDNGLSRYNLELDNFDNFINKPNDESSLQDNVIWDIYQNKEKSDSLLWISTTEGLHTLSVKTETQDVKFERIKVRNYNDRIREIKTIFQDKKGTYWLGSFDNGIHLLSSNLNYSGTLKKQNKFHLVIDANALYDMKTIDNQYWLATDNGLYIVDDRYQLISHVTEQAKKNTNNQALLSNNIRAIAQLDENHVWLATHNGLNTINLLNNNIESYQSSSKPNSISENWLMDIYRDNNNNMWLASYGAGINQHSPLTSLFHHRLASNGNQTYRVESFAETSDGLIWFSTEQQGLFNLSFKNEKNINHIELNLESGIEQIVADESNYIWLYTKNGELFEYRQNHKKLIKHNKWNNQNQNDLNNHLINIKNSLFYLKNGALYSYDTITQQFQHNSFKTEKLNFINIQKDKQNKLWLLSTQNEVYLYNYLDKSLLKIKGKFPASFKNTGEESFKVSENWIWLSSNSQGIALINKISNEITLFNYNMFKGSNITSIEIDEVENAWLATNTGLSLINPTTKKISNFDSDFGINTPQFYNRTAFNSKNDQLFFGSSNGFYQFTPDQILQTKQNTPAPIFTNLYVVNKKIKVHNNDFNLLEKNTYTTKKQLNSLDKVELAYKQSPVSFEFTSPNTKLPHQLRYRYRLLELENKWVDAAVDTGIYNNRATYTNLSPGDYIFEVQAYDIYTPSEAKTSQLNVRILPPWWLSIGMMIVYGVLVLLFLTYVFQQYRNKQLYNSQIKESEERLKLSLWGSGDEMWDWNIITDKIYRSNIWGILDFPLDGTRNKTTETDSVGKIKTNIHQHDIKRVKVALEEHFAEKTEHFEATYRVKNKHNRWVWILDRGKIVERDDANNPTRMTGTLKDISQIKQAEERLKLFARCIQNISDAVVIYDRQFVAVDVNKAFQRITGKERSQMIGRSLTFSQYPKSFTQNIKKHLVNEGSWYGEIESIRADGSLYLTDLNIDIIHDENNNISHFVGVFSDITKRKETEAELRKLASSDTLTGLPNRSYFQANQARLVKSNISHALLVFDLDNFKKINDSLGHQIGDAILCQVAQRMLTLGRKQDTVYRLGGDEFSIIIEGTNDIHTITSLAKDILRTVALPFKIKNQEIVLYSSIGIVLFPEDGITGHELLKNADTAMYHAKGSGGNKYQFFSESMNKQAVKRLQIESLIRHGLKDDSFSVYYQPKIEIATGKVAGMEALVRFETPSKGIISPVVFIPVSEETGQIIDIGEIVLRKACFATKQWVDAGLFDGRVAVNLSAVQFTQNNLVTLIADILKESKLPAKHLELEITEGTVMDSPQAAIDTMLQIRAMGIHLSLDDFGTGYSSLAYLKKFPLNTLKIDKAFVDDIEESEQGRNMVATIVTIAHNLGMDVVAEGVETNQQLSFLSGLRCELLQGYLYSKPLATEHFQKYLLAHQITSKSTSFSG